jgi:hypothetical protein
VSRKRKADTARGKVEDAGMSSKAAQPQAPPTKRTKKASAVEVDSAEDLHTTSNSSQPEKRSARNKKVEVAEVVKDGVDVEENGGGDTKAKKNTKKSTPKKKKKKEVEIAPLAEQTTDTPLIVGAHVSSAGG